MERQGRILVVEDNERWREQLRETLQASGFLVETVATTAAAWQRLAETFYHLLVLDIQMNDTDQMNTEGMSTLDELQRREIDDAVEVIMLSAYGTREQMRKAFRKYKVADFQDKREFDDQTFLEQVHKLFAEDFRINLRLQIFWQQAGEPEQIVLHTEFAGARVRRSNPDLIARAATELDDLLCRLFYQADQLLVQPLTAGHSGAGVLWAQPALPAGGGRPVVVKFGEAPKIRQEYNNFKKFVQLFIGGGRSTTVHDVRYTPQLGGISYSLLGAANDHVEDFGSFYRRANIEQIATFLDHLFDETCGAWYANRGHLQFHDLSAEYLETLGCSPERLEQALAEQLKTVQGKQQLRFRSLPGERTFTNPILALAGRRLVRQTCICTTHGDFNEGNILVDGNSQAWLIDFLRTGPGHILRDVVLLDSVVRTRLLQPDEATLEERLEMEELLCSASRFSQIDELAAHIPQKNAALAKACATSLHLRRIARRLTMRNQYNDIEEYSIASLYQMLNMIRFYWMPAAQREHALLGACLLADRINL